ncbi:hypothetical protein B0T19DRAFT_150762 [Cercophora scortea]|uniref:Uncharacterized protein n=1 Tax=Cercophora scortea TaxID=314031 RepID=A0AAE0ILJ9_9PEZI|nr:hypothetical protein B0T19DRAFT_150762 [Cercophora scortea]
MGDGMTGGLPLSLLLQLSLPRHEIRQTGTPIDLHTVFHGLLYHVDLAGGAGHTLTRAESAWNGYQFSSHEDSTTSPQVPAPGHDRPPSRFDQPASPGYLFALVMHLVAQRDPEYIDVYGTSGHPGAGLVPGSRIRFWYGDVYGQSSVDHSQPVARRSCWEDGTMPGAVHVAKSGRCLHRLDEIVRASFSLLVSDLPTPLWLGFDERLQV